MLNLTSCIVFDTVGHWSRPVKIVIFKIQMETVQGFHGVYLLCSKSEVPRFRNRTYIGYTVNPNRRINQHNKGRKFGGAKKTSDRGPWEMVMTIHGFPNNISALRFEWAWQQPNESRRLKVFPDLQRRKARESHLDYHFRVLAVMLRIGPWNRLPLTIRWLLDDYACTFPIGCSPPVHMPICHGRVKIKKIPKLSATDQLANDATAMTTTCKICYDYCRPDNIVNCISPSCCFVGHLKCLAKLFLEPGQYVPIQGTCPSCKKSVLWGDLMRKKNGCSDLEDCSEFESEEDGDSDDNGNFME